jgi:hypothetical protein
MALFVIIPTVQNTKALDAAIMERFDKKCYKLPRGEWLAAYDGTSKQLSDDLKISAGEIGVSAVILAFSGYFGRANKDIWEWISVNSKE